MLPVFSLASSLVQMWLWSLEVELWMWLANILREELRNVSFSRCLVNRVFSFRWERNAGYDFNSLRLISERGFFPALRRNESRRCSRAAFAYPPVNSAASCLRRDRIMLIFIVYYCRGEVWLSRCECVLPCSCSVFHQCLMTCAQGRVCALTGRLLSPLASCQDCTSTRCG